MPTAISADIDGDGLLETVQGNGTHTQVVKNGVVIWQHDGWIDGWNRGDHDIFVVAADVDGDGSKEVVVANYADHWTGLLKWQGGALHLPWGSPSPIDGWNRGPDDSFLAADIDGDGRDELILANDFDGWTGVMKWQAPAMHVIWGSPSPLPGPGGNWVRGGGDRFLPASFQGSTAVAVTHPADGNHAMLLWDGAGLEVAALTPDLLLDLVIPAQEQSYWCWVAAGSGVSSYYDRVSYRQCYVVTIVFQAIHPPWTCDCCNAGAEPCQSACNGESGADQALDHPSHHFAGNQGVLGIGDVKAQIDQGRPVLAEINWSGGGSHFVVITGYSLDAVPGTPYVYVQDPAAGTSWQPAGLPSYLGGGTWAVTTLSQP